MRRPSLHNSNHSTHHRISTVVARGAYNTTNETQTNIGFIHQNQRMSSILTIECHDENAAIIKQKVAQIMGTATGMPITGSQPTYSMHSEFSARL